MTETTRAESLTGATADESQVLEYLIQHPDILDRYPDVLRQLALVHDSGTAVSLVERQLKVLREENQTLKNKLNELVHIARENEELSQRFHRLSLELMTSHNLHDIIALIRDQIQTFFYTDYVGFVFAPRVRDRLEGLEKNVLDPSNKHAVKIQDWIMRRNPVFGPFDPGIRKLLFDQAAQIPSCVLIPLYQTHDFGLLALGSKASDRFNHGMGTLFLSQLGDLVSSKLKHFLD